MGTLPFGLAALVTGYGIVDEQGMMVYTYSVYTHNMPDRQSGSIFRKVAGMKGSARYGYPSDCRDFGYP